MYRLEMEKYLAELDDMDERIQKVKEISQLPTNEVNRTVLSMDVDYC